MERPAPRDRHRITHERAPLRWQEGLPLGNGRLGAMVWGDGRPLRLTLDHADLWDLRINEAFRRDPRYNYAGLRRLLAEKRFDEAAEVFEEREKRDNPLFPTKISLGRAELRLGGDPCPLSLDLDRGLVEGRRLSVFVHRERDLVCLRAAFAGELSFVALGQMVPAFADLGHPSPLTSRDGDVEVVVQEMADGPAHAVAWCRGEGEASIAVESACDGDQAAAKAVAAARRAREEGFEALLAENVAAWQAFWAESAVYLPEPDLELLWYLGVYLLASCSRRGSRPPGLQGVWAMDGVLPPWRGDYHADMNVQETFWPACSSGHLELLDTWCDHMREELPRAQALARSFFGTEGAFWPCSSLPNLTSVPSWYTVQFAWSSMGWLAWLVWLRWRYSLDQTWLAETGYPLVAEVFRFYRANVEEQADGRLHVPLSTSPEYRENRPEAWAQDPAIDLALIRRCSDWVCEMEAALGLGELTSAAVDLRRRLAPYPLTDSGALCLWPGRPLDESHRHPSHLMAIHPAMDLTLDGDAETQRIIAASVEQYLSLGQYHWAGHTYAQLVSFAAVLGRKGFAYDCLRQFADHWIGPNGLHFNADLALSGMSGYHYPEGTYGPFTIEANCGVAAGIGDMLVQGWGDRVRIFPAVPDHWRDVAFRDLLTEGAFRVSAVRRAGRTVWVRIRATVDRTLRLRNPFPDEEPVALGSSLRREGEDLLADLQAGQTLTISPPGSPTTLQEARRAVRRSNTSRLGLRRR